MTGSVLNEMVKPVLAALRQPVEILALARQQSYSSMGAARGLCKDAADAAKAAKSPFF
jgi:spore maturation protein SpmB